MSFKPHDKIWLQCYGDGDPEYDGPVDSDEMYWCNDKVNEHDVGYVKAELFDKYGQHLPECQRRKAYENLENYRMVKCDCGLSDIR